MSNVDEQIESCIAERRSFLLDAGAGSGKTYSLMLALRHVLATQGESLRRRAQQVACITYTNVAKDEIVKRTGNNPHVRVSTIHDFLWDLISGHQKPLKTALQIHNDTLEAKSTRKKNSEELSKALSSVAITYSEFGSNFLEGKLHHDDLIDVSGILFRENPLLSRIVASKYPIIFVDEYQDASPVVMSILVDGVIVKAAGQVVIGLFGDKLQSIYDGGVGELPASQLSRLETITKSDNRRCSTSVIDLLNRLRTDIRQVPTNNNVAGDAIYVRVSDPANALPRVREFVGKSRNWNLTSGTEKELYLTHRLIARKGGYDALLDLFTTRGGFYRDRMLTGEEPRMAYFLDRLEPVVRSWTEKRVGATLSILRRHGFELRHHDDKRVVAGALDELVRLRQEGTVRDVLLHLEAARLCPLLEEFRYRLKGGAGPKPAETPEEVEREEKEKAFYDGLFALPYREIAAFTEFFLEHTPFATKHGVKGAEYDSVFVVLDDKGANWNLYSFDKFLTKEDENKTPKRFRRTRNVLYVCCSRPKFNLAIVDLGAQAPAKDAAVQALFGKDRCFAI